MVRTNAVEFVAAGSPRALARAIEACADEQRFVSALVVPWESSGDALTMAVTSARVDGWAIAHTNLGTVRLTDLGDDTTRVEVLPDDHPEEKLAHLIEAFARQIQKRFEARR